MSDDGDVPRVDLTVAPTAGAIVFTGAVPFVSIDRNSPAYKETDEVLRQLEEAVKGSDLFADPDERLAIIREVRGVRELISESKVRVAAVWSAFTGNGVIVFLTKAFAIGAIHEIASQSYEVARGPDYWCIMTQITARIVHAKRPRPIRPPRPEPIARIVHAPSAKTLAAIKRWEALTGRSD